MTQRPIPCTTALQVCFLLLGVSIVPITLVAAQNVVSASALSFIIPADGSVCSYPEYPVMNNNSTLLYIVCYASAHGKIITYSPQMKTTNTITAAAAACSDPLQVAVDPLDPNLLYIGCYWDSYGPSIALLNGTNVTVYSTPSGGYFFNNFWPDREHDVIYANLQSGRDNAVFLIDMNTHSSSVISSLKNCAAPTPCPAVVPWSEGQLYTLCQSVDLSAYVVTVDPARNYTTTTVYRDGTNCLYPNRAFIHPFTGQLFVGCTNTDGENYALMVFNVTANGNSASVIGRGQTLLPPSVCMVIWTEIHPITGGIYVQCGYTSSTSPPPTNAFLVLNPYTFSIEVEVPSSVILAVCSGYVMQFVIDSRLGLVYSACYGQGVLAINMTNAQAPTVQPTASTSSAAASTTATSATTSNSSHTSAAVPAGLQHAKTQVKEVSIIAVLLVSVVALMTNQML